MEREQESEYAEGECTDMCPPAERAMRKKNRLVHVLERSPKPEAERMVKCFVRSAAGKNMNDPANLRTPETLLKTVHYLIAEMLPNRTQDARIVFDFIMDRLRSVRQDMVIQNLPLAYSICLLQPMVGFYAYTSYRLCEMSLAEFDPHINRTHLQECLKRLLVLYDECDKLFRNRPNVDNASFIKVLERTRPFFEAMYVIFNLGSSIALTRALDLPKQWRTDLVNKAVTLSLDDFRDNFVRVCRGFHDLPVLLKGVAAIHLPAIRRRAFKSMSLAYNSKREKYPLEDLKRLLLYDNEELLKKDLMSYGLKVEESGVYFIKSDFVEPANPVSPTNLEFITQEYCEADIPDLILNPH